MHMHARKHTRTHIVLDLLANTSVSQKSALDIFLCQHTRNDPIDFDLCKISQSKHIP